MVFHRYTIQSLVELCIHMVFHDNQVIFTIVYIVAIYIVSVYTNELLLS